MSSSSVFKIFVHVELLDVTLTVLIPSILNNKKTTLAELKSFIITRWAVELPDKPSLKSRLFEVCKTVNGKPLQDETQSLFSCFHWSKMGDEKSGTMYTDCYLDLSLMEAMLAEQNIQLDQVVVLDTNRKTSSASGPPPLEAIPRGQEALRPSVNVRRAMALHVSPTELQESSINRVHGCCAYCYLPIAGGKNAKTVKCNHCSKKNVIVSVVTANASCSQCNSPTARKLGEDELKCTSCKSMSLEGKCKHCGSRYVFPAALRNAPALPCSNPMCGKKTSAAEAIVRDDPIPERVFLQTQSFVSDYSKVGQNVKPKEDAPWLIVQTYVDNKKDRRDEIFQCLARNLRCPYIAGVLCLTESKSDQQKLLKTFAGAVKSNRLVLQLHGRRLTFADAFAAAHESHHFPDHAICIVANADVYFDDTLDCLIDNPMYNVVYALSRYDVLKSDEISFSQFLAPLSQDAWIFRRHRVIALKNVTSAREVAAKRAKKMIKQGAKDSTPLRKRVSNEATLQHMSLGRYNMGHPGADNRLVYELRRDQAIVRNNCREIYVYHLHTSQIRHYTDETKKVPPPYNSVDPE